MPKRWPRSHFTKKLLGMLGTLDANPVRSYQFNAAFNWQEPKFVPASTRMKKVWVYGSYARGAQTCGDLDVQIEVDHIEVAGCRRTPPERSTVAAFWKALRGVHVTLARPEWRAEESAIDRRIKQDLKLVWAEGLDWRSAVAGLQEAPDASRRAREFDRLRFSRERLRLPIHEAWALAMAHKHGLLASECFPLQEVELKRVRRDERHALQAIELRRGREAIRAGRAVIALARSMEAMAGSTRTGWFYGFERSYGFELPIWGGFQLQLGGANFGVSTLERRKDLEGFLVVPFIRSTEANGAWMVRRGPNFGVENEAYLADLERARSADGMD